MLRQELANLRGWQAHHHRLVARLLLILVGTLIIDAAGTILIFLFERHARLETRDNAQRAGVACCRIEVEPRSGPHVHLRIDAGARREQQLESGREDPHPAQRSTMAATVVPGAGCPSASRIVPVITPPRISRTVASTEAPRSSVTASGARTSVRTGPDIVIPVVGRVPVGTRIEVPGRDKPWTVRRVYGERDDPDGWDGFIPCGVV